MVELRRKFFTDSERRTTLAASVLDAGWIGTVGQSPGPYFFVAETVFVYLKEQEVKAALAQIGESFSSVNIAFDTVSRKAADRANQDHARRRLDGRFAWVCEDPREIEGWNIGLNLVDPGTMADVLELLKPNLSWPLRTTLRIFRKSSRKAYQIHLFAGQSAC